LRNGALLELRDRRGRTPFYLACSKGHESLVRELLEGYGANMEAPSSNGTRPIHACAKYGRDNVLQLLVAAGVDVRATSSHRPQHMLGKELCFANALKVHGINQPNLVAPRKVQYTPTTHCYIE
jgi:ankyrin repeat protein